MTRSRLLRSLLVASALAASAAPGAAQLPPLPPGLDSAEVARARSCALVEATYIRGQTVGVALQDTLVLLTDLVSRIDADARFQSGSTGDGRAYLTFEAGEGEALRVDTVFAGTDLFPMLSGFTGWQDRNTGALEAGDATAQAEFTQRRSDLRAYVRSRGRALLERVQQLPPLLQDLQVQGQMCVADVRLLRAPIVAECDAQEFQTGICMAARGDSTAGTMVFVDSVEEIWADQSLGEWLSHTPISAGEGGLTGGQVQIAARAGNALFEMSLGPLVRPREGMEADQVTEFDAVLDSLAIDFAHESYAMVPLLQIRTNITVPLSAESYYLLHAGPVEGGQSIWSAQATGQLLGTQIVLSPDLLAILEGPEEIRLSAVNVVDEETLQPIWSIPLATEGRATTVRALMDYLGTTFSGELDAAIAQLEARGEGDSGGVH